MAERLALSPARIAIRRLAPVAPVPEPLPPATRIVRGRRTDVRVYVTDGAMADVWDAVTPAASWWRWGERERGGALVGRYAIDGAQRFVVVTGAVPAPDAPSSSIHIEIRHEDWNGFVACEKCGSRVLRVDHGVMVWSKGRLVRVSCAMCGWDRHLRR